MQRILARALAAGYRDSAAARAFIEDALQDQPGWRGATRVTALCLTDILVTQWRPQGWPVTAAPLTTSRLSTRSTFMDRLLQDLRGGLRQLRHQPAFSLVAILTMALGVGANTAIFTVAWRALLKPLPYPNSAALVEIWETYGSDTRTNLSMPPKFHDLRNQATSYASVAAYSGLRLPADLTGGGDPTQLQIRAVSADYFRVFDLAPLLGRWLNAEDLANDTGAVVISEGLWRRRYDASPSVIGRQVTLGGDPATIVGVMPSVFDTSGDDVDVWSPLQLPPESDRRTGHYLRVVGRLADGVSVEQADAEAKAISARAAALYPALEKDLSAHVVPLADGVGTARGDTKVRSGVLMLTLAAAVVLLIACANLASLQLARGVARAREFGIRAALGASRVRMATQMLTEGLVIAVLGAAGGLALGWFVLRELAAVAPPAIAAAASAGPDAAVIAYALALSVISAIVFALAPAWRAATGATRWLRQRGEGADRGSARLRLGLVVGQIAAAAMLLVGAAFLVSSLARVMQVSPGFQPEGSLTFDVTTNSRFDDFASTHQFFANLTARIGALPGVTSVCGINAIPFETQGGMTYVPDGQTMPIGANPRTVTGDCFGALGISIIGGRDFGPNEQDGVVIVSQSFARQAWPNQNPIGQRLHMGVIDGPLVEVVGVSADILSNSLEARAPYPQVYQAWTPSAYFVPSHMIVRSAIPPDRLFGAIRQTVRDVDPDQPVAKLRTMNAVVARSTSSRRFDLTLLASFALVALALSAVGVYGMLSQLVAQRTGEIGLRMALGATPASIVRLILHHAALAIAVGLPLGIGGAYLARRVVSQFLFGVTSRDPVIYLLVAAILALVVFVAAVIPARRAARVDPADTIRA